ncbi:hypothetical protein PFISCL1PPCAC_24973, partial [Pristionchus fissidentatus]
RIEVESNEKLVVYCKRRNCDITFLEINFENEINFDGKTLRCNSKMRMLRINGKFRKDNLICHSQRNQWMDINENEIGLRGDEIIYADCLTPCFTNLDKNEGSTMPDGQGGLEFSLVCDGSTTAIQHIPPTGTKRYENLRCDYKNGWRDQNGKMIGEAGVQLEVTCEQYCDYTTHPEIVEESTKYDLTISCQKENYALSNPSIQKPIRSGLSCSLNGGWKDKDNNVINDNNEKQFKVECKKRCTVKTPLSPDIIQSDVLTVKCDT